MATHNNLPYLVLIVHLWREHLCRLELVMHAWWSCSCSRFENNKKLITGYDWIISLISIIAASRIVS